MLQTVPPHCWNRRLIYKRLDHSTSRVASKRVSGTNEGRLGHHEGQNWWKGSSKSKNGRETKEKWSEWWNRCASIRWLVAARKSATTHRTRPVHTSSTRVFNPIPHLCRPDAYFALFWGEESSVGWKRQRPYQTRMFFRKNPFLFRLVLFQRIPNDDPSVPQSTNLNENGNKIQKWLKNKRWETINLALLTLFHKLCKVALSLFSTWHPILFRKLKDFQIWLDQQFVSFFFQNTFL